MLTQTKSRKRGNGKAGGRTPPGMDQRLTLRPAEVAAALGVSRTKAYELIARGEVPSIKVGGTIMVPVDALRDWLKAQTKSAADQ